MKEKISVIIVNYKVKKLLLECIRSLHNSSYKNLEIIVIENDEEANLEKDLFKLDKKILYIKSPKNLGYGAGNNLGALYAIGKYLFFLNPDTEVDKGAINHLKNFLDKNKQAGIVAPILIGKENQLMRLQGSSRLTPKSAILSQSFIGKILSPFNIERKKYWHLDWDKKSVEEVDVVPGTAFMIRRDIFEKINGFDEDLFLFFDENQICKKVQNLGLRNFMLPKALVKHYWGESTKYREDTEKIFKQSRFKYFRKNYGLLNAVMTTTLLNFGKYQLLILLTFLLSLFLNLYKIKSQIRFIGDQGWFYMSARDLALYGKIPLVGITSSHTWLHQGALWTYILALTLKVSNFNPLIGFYFVGIMSSIAVYLLYKLGSYIFNKKVGIIAAFILATSPLYVIHSRMSYHTTLIPLITTIFIFSVYKWVNGDRKFFPICITIIAVLYNFELATFGMAATFGLVLFWGLLRKHKFATQILNLKTILYSAIGFFIVMLPMILYDIHHGFPQTLKFIVWIFYRLAVFMGYPPVSNFQGESWGTFFTYNSQVVSQFLFRPSILISYLVLIFGYVIFVLLLIKNIKSKSKSAYIIVYLFFTLPFIGFVLQKTNSDAYTLIFFPTIALILGSAFNFIARDKLNTLLVVTFLLIIAFFNINFLLKSHFLTDLTFQDRLNAAKYIIKEANGKPFNIKGEGVNSQYISFTMNHEYLLWYLGTPPSHQKEKLRFIISEKPYKINIRVENK